MDQSAELVLYIIDDSPSCERARDTLERALRHFDERDVRLLVRNLTRDPLTDDDARVIVVPTLVMRKPHLEYLAGDVEVDMLDDMLTSAGVRRVRTRGALDTGR